MNSTLHKILYYSIVFLSTILIVAGLLSLVHDIPKWYLKVLDFPRLQQLILAVLLLIFFILLNRSWKIPAITLSTGLISVIIIHFSFISPYLLGSKAAPQMTGTSDSSGSNVSILLGNVLMTNKNSAGFLEIIKNSKPDIILAMEVNDWWVKQLTDLEKDYPHVMLYPSDNAYGMALYSKYPLLKRETKFFNHSKVPSFHTTISLPSGKTFRFHGVHPVAPFPSDKYPENIGEKNGEGPREVALLKVGDLVAKDKEPSMVAGDFNDVAWSNTSRLFGQNGDLKDVRIGRGLYNTFDATSALMRWPLDHFYVTSGISVLEFERLENFGSDHFPLFGKFVIE